MILSLQQSRRADEEASAIRVIALDEKTVGKWSFSGVIWDF
jgi:hypothetical protein